MTIQDRRIRPHTSHARHVFPRRGDPITTVAMDKEYKYTANNSALSDEQRQFYEENGYIIFKKFIPDTNLDKCYERFLQVCNGDTANVSKISRISEWKNSGLKDEYTINNIHNFERDPTFFDNYIGHENIIKVVASIIGPNITAFNSMLINKPPNAPHKYSRYVPHQDQYYMPFGPPNRIVNSWTAMENITEENGCLFVWPGTHKGKLFPHSNSKGFRKAISVHYADSNCYFADHKATTSENAKIEILKTNYNNLEHYYKSRSRLVAGRPGNFQDIRSHL